MDEINNIGTDLDAFDAQITEDKDEEFIQLDSDLGEDESEAE